MPVTSLRELRVLQSCQHQNIVHLKEVVTGSKPERWEAKGCLLGKCASRQCLQCCAVLK